MEMLTANQRENLIHKIEALPDQVETLIANATDTQLLRPYKPGGWNSRQVVHHLADSHMNAYIRAKLIATEENPPLKPYDQDAWAGFADGHSGPLQTSQHPAPGLHARWAAFFGIARGSLDTIRPSSGKRADDTGKNPGGLHRPR